MSGSGQNWLRSLSTFGGARPRPTPLRLHTLRSHPDEQTPSRGAVVGRLTGQQHKASGAYAVDHIASAAGAGMLIKPRYLDRRRVGVALSRAASSLVRALRAARGTLLSLPGQAAPTEPRGKGKGPVLNDPLSFRAPMNYRARVSGICFSYDILRTGGIRWQAADLSPAKAVIPADARRKSRTSGS
jgi:hypothetical protein